MDNDFLLKSEPAKKLYHEYAKKMPIIDYHCHINPADIANDLRYTSVTDVVLGGDHYKWRLLRANGVPESGVTEARNGDPFVLFKNFADALPKAIGNPVYHWTHLELQRYFGIDKPLCGDNAREIYDECNKKLAEPDMSVRGIIRKSNVQVICTTDDPCDDLAFHTQTVLPSFRPDRAMNIQNDGFTEYIRTLSAVSGVQITDFHSLCRALENRADFFKTMGCRSSDHGLGSCVFSMVSDKEADDIMRSALNGETISGEDVERFQTAFLLHMGKVCRERGWVMQIHFGALRNVNTRMFERVGADSGFDCINGDNHTSKLAKLLDALDRANNLPKTILYSLNPADNEVLIALAACFNVQVGAAWWFNDTKSGIEKHLRDYANGSLLGNFVGMLTDSRSFLSYTRHEYFRRILCNFLGQLVSDGEYPEDYETLGKMVEDICYYNTARYFGFNEGVTK